jgi:hypothetical protein
MKKSLSQSLKLAVLGAAMLASVVGARGQSFSMQLVADNDFAVFGGTATSVNDLIYQNDYSWPAQLGNLSTLSFDLPQGDTTFYLLGMGGGGEENISGTVNGIDITTLGDISMSSDLSTYLTGYLVSDGMGGYVPDGIGGFLTDPSVAAGTYDASLADVQTAFPNLTWDSPTINYTDGVIQSSPNHEGFDFADSTAHLFSFSASDVGVTAAPEPSTWALVAVGVALIGRKFIFRRSHLYVLRTLAAASCMMLDRKLIHRRQQHRSTI